jgi:hypothetical protein
MARRQQPRLIQGHATHRRTQGDYMGALLLDTATLEDWRDGGRRQSPRPATCCRCCCTASTRGDWRAVWPLGVVLLANQTADYWTADTTLQARAAVARDVLAGGAAPCTDFPPPLPERT